MGSQYFDKAILKAMLLRIREAVVSLLDWNKEVNSVDDWLMSSHGMQNLAANCMMIEAIGEIVGKIEKYAGIEFLNQCDNIPWLEIKSMRNHIAHAYFEIDVEYVYNVIKNDLQPLLIAIDKLITSIE